MKALILAAGKGTRISHLTHHCPKPMLPVAGKPLLEHLIGWLSHHGISDIAINLHYLPHVIPAYFGDGQRHGVRITYSYEPALLGTAGAAKRLEAFLDERFVLIFGDIFTNFGLQRLLDWHADRFAHARALASLALYHVPNPTECGLVALDAQGAVLRFVEKPPPDQVFGDLANSGILVCEPSILQWVPADTVEDVGRDLLPRLLAAGQLVTGLELNADEFVVDIGTPAGYARAQASIRQTQAAPAVESC